MKLTDNERTALQAIVKTAKREGAVYVPGWPVDSAKYNPFPNKRTLAGVHASLSTKGLVDVTYIENARGRAHIEQVRITEDGLAAVQQQQRLKSIAAAGLPKVAKLLGLK